MTNSLFVVSFIADSSYFELQKSHINDRLHHIFRNKTENGNAKEKDNL